MAAKSSGVLPDSAGCHAPYGTVAQREGTGRCTVVEKPADHRGIVLPGREVQRRDTIDVARTDERRVGFHQGDGLRGAALGDGLPQRIDRRAGGRPLVAELRAAIVFLALDDGDDLAVLAVDGDGIRRGRVAVRPDAHARVRAELHQDAGQLRIATQHGAMQRAVAELGVTRVDQVGPRLRRAAARPPRHRLRPPRGVPRSSRPRRAA